METHVVTGAFGFSGKHIASRLLEAGINVRTLTDSGRRTNPFGGKITVSPYHFDDPPQLAAALQGADVLYNTYWVRFNHKDFTHQAAVENTITLFRAAREAGVRRIVHISITNPAEDSELEYFRGKARLERELIESGISYAILRPAVLFGKGDILINNIAWALRRLPVFGVFGDGEYRLQPIYVDDLAQIAVREGGGNENKIIDAIGPETFTYRELIKKTGEIIGCRRPLVSVSPGIGYWTGYLIGKIVGDTLITREEIDGLMKGLLYSDSPPAGNTSFREWAGENADTLGRKYSSELARRRDRGQAYEDL